MSPTVSLSFKYTEHDYVRAVRAHYASRLHLRLDIAVVLVALAAGVYFLRSPGHYWLGVVCMAGGSALGLMLIAAFTVIPQLVFRRELKFGDEYLLTFSPEDIHFRTVHIDSHLQWSMYSRALIDAHSYILYYGPRQFTVIPKRVFQRPEEQHAFERLLTQQVSEIVRRDT